MNINILIILVLVLMIILKINKKLNIDSHVLFFICVLVLLLIYSNKYEHLDLAPNVAQIYSDNNMVLPQLKIVGDLEIGGKLKVNTSKNSSSPSDPILRVFANQTNKLDYYSSNDATREHAIEGTEIDPATGNTLTNQMKVIFTN